MSQHKKDCMNDPVVTVIWCRASAARATEVVYVQSRTWGGGGLDAQCHKNGMTRENYDKRHSHAKATVY